jgi:hypothetical protein
VQLCLQIGLELSGIIMEINDLQKTFLDNQALAQTILEINGLRGFCLSNLTSTQSVLVDVLVFMHFGGTFFYFF